MELRQLQYLVAVAEQGGFTRAAVLLHVAQPAISQQIALLERELGERLFVREPRRVRLTPAGEAFLPHARAALGSVRAGRESVAELRGVLAGELRLGTIPSPPPELLDRFAGFRERQPRVRLLLRTGDPEALVADVLSGALDLALIGVSGPRLVPGPQRRTLPPQLADAPFAAEPLVLAVPPGHPLAGAGTVAVADLAGLPLVTLTPGTGLRADLDAACALAGFAPELVAETDDLALLAALAGRGLGAAVIPSSAALRAPLPLVLLALAEPAPSRPMVLVWHRDRASAPTRAFLSAAAISPPAASR